VTTPANGAPDVNDDSMPFLDHIRVLRGHLIKAALALVIATLLTSFFAGDIIEFLQQPYGDRLVGLGPTENVVTYFRVALISGATLAMPFIVYQLLAFIIPGLTRAERRWIYLSLPFITLLFLGGILFAWYIMIPAAIGFLADFRSDLFSNEWRAKEYISFVTSLVFWIGVSFQMPLIVFILAKVGLVTPGFLARNWRFAIVIVAIISAVITPTVDPFNMALLMLPLLGLYGLSIILAMLA
jgi:sec-independent protein translocase protein TatC